MKLKELRCVLSANMVNLYFDIGEKETYVHEKDSQDNDYLELKDDNKSMWETHGELKIEQIYSEDTETINIDLVIE